MERQGARKPGMRTRRTGRGRPAPLPVTAGTGADAEARSAPLRCEGSLLAEGFLGPRASLLAPGGGCGAAFGCDAQGR